MAFSANGEMLNAGTIQSLGVVLTNHDLAGYQASY